MKSSPEFRDKSPEFQKKLPESHEKLPESQDSSPCSSHTLEVPHTPEVMTILKVLSNIYERLMKDDDVNYLH